jgi:hypothetical protein
VTGVACDADTGRPSAQRHQPEPQQLAVDLRSSPIRVRLRYALDQSANLLGNFRWAAARPGSPTPIETAADAVPSDHGVRFDEYQDIRPAGPTAAEGFPEQSVQGVQLRPGPLPLQHGDLLSEGEDVESYFASITEEDSVGRSRKSRLPCLRRRPLQISVPRPAR